MIDISKRDQIDQQTEDIDQRIKELCPKGVDIYFDNVGGETLDIMTRNLAYEARIVLCGFMTQYNLSTPPPGPNPSTATTHTRTCGGGCRPTRAYHILRSVYKK